MEQDCEEVRLQLVEKYTRFFFGNKHFGLNWRHTNASIFSTTLEFASTAGIELTGPDAACS